MMPTGYWSDMTFIVILFLSGFQLVCSQDFGYDGKIGPTHWGEQYNTCFGKHQSPININSLTVNRVALPPLIFDGFDRPPDKTSITNNGHTVMVTLDSEYQPTVSGGPLDGVYEFAQLHFHWGDNDSVGSEDLIDGRSFPMELHMVFYKKVYRNVRSSLDYTDGLTVLAFFYNIDTKPNLLYEEFTTLLNNITSPKMSVSFDRPPSLRDLIPMDTVHYYTYNGSLTTPPCSEVVTWIDFQQPIMLSHEQIESFRILKDSHGHNLTHNFRPIQPIGDRIILYNTGEDIIDNDNSLDKHPTITPNDEIPVEVTDEEDSVRSDQNDNSLDHPDKELSDVVSNDLDSEPSKEDKDKDNKSVANQNYQYSIVIMHMALILIIQYIHLK